MNDDVLKRALERERQSRQEAERLLEQRSRQLYQNNQELSATLEDLRDSQTRLLESEKMAAIGLLSAGIAHEINNPIGFVGVNLDNLGEGLTRLEREVSGRESALDTLDEMREILTESAEGLRRVSAIVRDLRTFAYREEAHPEAADLNEIIRDVLRLLRNELAENRTVTEQYCPTCQVLCRPSGIAQVVMNLVVNAHRAVEGGGDIWVTTAVRDGQAVVEVADNGPGIPEEHRNHIFEPFFTTRKVGEGTGLGLALSFEIVKRHGGHLELDTDFEDGTRFRFNLPLC